MGSMNKNVALGAALMAAFGLGGAIDNAQREGDFEPTIKNRGSKGEGYHSRPSGAAAAKRAARKRRNIRAHASKRA